MAKSATVYVKTRIGAFSKPATTKKIVAKDNFSIDK